MKRLVRCFWALCLGSVLAFVVLVSLRAVGLVPQDWISVSTPLKVPLLVGGVLCVMLGLIDSVNATARWARRHDRCSRCAYGPNRSQRRRRRTRR